MLKNDAKTQRGEVKRSAHGVGAGWGKRPRLPVGHKTQDQKKKGGLSFRERKSALVGKRGLSICGGKRDWSARKKGSQGKSRDHQKKEDRILVTSTHQGKGRRQHHFEIGFKPKRKAGNWDEGWTGSIMPGGREDELKFPLLTSLPILKRYKRI